VPTQAVVVVTAQADLGILPTSTSRPSTATLAPTLTPLPILDQPSGGPIQGAPAATAAAVAPPPPAIDNPLIAAGDAFVVDPNTLQVRRPSASPSVLVAAVGPGGMVAIVHNRDSQYPGFGYSLSVEDEALIGSPLPSDTIRFTQVAWSPNGARVAFIAETPGARGDGSARIGDTPSDGLWVWTLSPGQATQFTHHALHNRYAYIHGRDGARIVDDFAWSPDGNVLLVTLARAGGYPGVLGLITPGWNADSDPAILRHEHGMWSLDGSRILVSGIQTDVGPVLGWVDRETQAFTPLVNGQTLTVPLWMGHAAEMQDGRIALIGAPYNPGDPGAGGNSPDVGLYIYNAANVEPVRVSYIGGGPVLEAQWNAAHSAVLLKLADGRTVIAQTSGTVTDISGQVGGSNVRWGG
jgi:WD40 repeat protein